MIWALIQNHKEEFSKNDGWFKDQAKLKLLQSTLRKDVTIRELQVLARDNWYADDTDADEDDDDDPLTDDEDDIRYNKLSSKEKKHSQLSTGIF